MHYYIGSSWGLWVIERRRNYIILRLMLPFYKWSYYIWSLFSLELEGLCCLLDIDRDLYPWKVKDFWHSLMWDVRKEFPIKWRVSSIVRWRWRNSPVSIFSLILRCHYLAINGSKSLRIWLIAIISWC